MRTFNNLSYVSGVENFTAEASNRLELFMTSEEGVQRLAIFQEANYFFLDISMYITIIHSHGLPNESSMYQTEEWLAAVLLKYTGSPGRSS